MVIFKCDYCGFTQNSKYTTYLPEGWGYRDMRNHEGCICRFCVEKETEIIAEERERYNQRVHKRLRELENPTCRT